MSNRHLEHCVGEGWGLGDESGLVWKWGWEWRWEWEWNGQEGWGWE